MVLLSVNLPGLGPSLTLHLLFPQAHDPPMTPSSLSTLYAEEPSLAGLFTLFCLWHAPLTPLTGFVCSCPAFTPAWLHPQHVWSGSRIGSPSSPPSPSSTIPRRHSIQENEEELTLFVSCLSHHIISHHNSLWDESQIVSYDFIL